MQCTHVFACRHLRRMQHLAVLIRERSNPDGGNKPRVCTGISRLSRIFAVATALVQAAKKRRRSRSSSASSKDCFLGQHEPQYAGSYELTQKSAAVAREDGMSGIGDGIGGAFFLPEVFCVCPVRSLLFLSLPNAEQEKNVKTCRCI